MLLFHVIVATHPRRPPNFFPGLPLIPCPLLVVPAPARWGLPVIKSFPYLPTSLAPHFLFPNSFPLNPFADPHPLTPLESYRLKSIGGWAPQMSDLTKSFVCNIYGPSRKCCKHRTYKDIKSFRCNTYKKQGG